MIYLLEIAGIKGARRAVSIMSPEWGDVPAEAIVGEVTEILNPISPDHFTPNSKFVRLLHHCVERFAPHSPALIEEAARQVNGIIYVIDARTQSPLGTV